MSTYPVNSFPDIKCFSLSSIIALLIGWNITSLKIYHFHSIKVHILSKIKGLTIYITELKEDLLERDLSTVFP